MNCHNCARRTLGLFIRSVTSIEPVFAPRHAFFKATRPSRDFSATHRTQAVDRPRRAEPEPIPTEKAENIENVEEHTVESRRERPSWAIQKEALKTKFGGEGWNPRKKLSPDTMEGIRHLHATKPNQFTTPVLANHFKVSPEAIRRILKSKWRPSEAEYEARMQRWDKRGERIWTNLVEMGVKPPKRWREMGVGRVQRGERPNWKNKGRNLVDVRDSVSGDFRDLVLNDDIIPTVDRTGRSNKVVKIPLSERI